ncbi:MAG: hypothetical protein ABF633_02785 [Clostridium sp.]|uniref:hypothetical protein n=1 Tax=Clostridium sp. TaxID=1506 RepID=UPI0039E8CF91
MRKTKRIVFECMHGLNLQFSNSMDKINFIITSNQTKFPNVNFNPSTNLLHLSNPNIKGNLLIDSNRMVMDIQDPIDIDEIYKNYMQSINMLIENFNINQFMRVGIRIFIGEEKDNPKDIEKIILNKFINKNNISVSEYGEDIIDVRFGFGTSYGEYKINHNFSKLINQNITVSYGRTETKTNYFIIYDIDFYKDVPSPSNSLDSIFKDAKDRISVCSDKFFSSIGDAK